MIVVPVPSDLPVVRDLHAIHHPGYPHPEGKTLGAYINGRFVGYAIYKIEGPHLILVDTGVEPWAMGHGVGTALMQARIEIAGECGCEMVVGTTQPRNAPMLQILRRFGFSECGVVPRAYADGSDALIFALYLKATK
jgi:ribosomal protein S18 acetylase RimI-like enzyme